MLLLEVQVEAELVHGVDGELDGVHVRGQAEPGAGEQGVEVVDRAVVEHGAGGEQEHGVEHLDDARAGLVDAEHHGAAPRLGHGPERADDLEGGGAVETGGGLVEHQHGRVTHGLDADGHAATLAAGEVLDPGVGDACQREVVDERVDRGGIVRVRAEAEAGAEVERLAHGEQREEDVALGDVAAEAAQGRGVDGGAIDAEVSRRGGAGLKAAGEDLEQRGLAGAAGADDGEQLAGAGAAADVAEDEAAPAAAAERRRRGRSRVEEEVVGPAPYLERVRPGGDGDVVVDARGLHLAPAAFYSSALHGLARQLVVFLDGC
uniref:Predicted protein n=1 Tax=Hordeum vulgare subsp. vulgare TaxID=112509 RepID=F2DBH7_HORVV|nr:predicted protein [Hordeum vulgare subsp. vulgare]